MERTCLQARIWFKRLLAADLDHYFSVSWAVEFAEKDALPGAELQFSGLYQDLFAAADKRAFAVGIGVSLGMPVARAIVRYQFGQGQEYVVRNTGVGIFVYGNCCGCVRTIDYYIAIGNAGLADN